MDYYINMRVTPNDSGRLKRGPIRCFGATRPLRLLFPQPCLAESLFRNKIAESLPRYKISALNRDPYVGRIKCHFVFATLVFRVKELSSTYEMRGNHGERSANKSRTDIFMRQKRAKIVA